MTETILYHHTFIGNEYYLVDDDSGLGHYKIFRNSECIHDYGYGQMYLAKTAYWFLIHTDVGNAIHNALMFKPLAHVPPLLSEWEWARDMCNKEIGL